MGLLPLTYTRPSYVSHEKFRNSLVSLGKDDKASLRSGKSGVSSGIPNNLSFEKIISGTTCRVSHGPRCQPPPLIAHPD